MDRATIFYNDAQWLRKEPAIFDWRYDAQILPSGSVISAFLLIEGHDTKELASPPAMTDEQEQNYEAVLTEARTALYNSIHPPVGSWT